LEVLERRVAEGVVERAVGRIAERVAKLLLRNYIRL
jgi:hypothetical protein